MVSRRIDSGPLNVGTRFNVAFTDAVRGRLAADRDVVDPRRYLADARGAMGDVASRLLDLFGATSRG